MNEALSRAGMARAFAWANNRGKVVKVVVSWLQRPPTSMASTTSLQRRVWRSSGYARSFARLASWTAAPAYTDGHIGFSAH